MDKNMYITDVNTDKRKNEEYKSIYNKAYSLIGDKTPLNTDCGVLCNKICCNNEFEDEDKGMFLFPGEEVMYEGLPDSEWSVRRTAFEYLPGKGVLLVVCNGKCDRKNRPLACRIFPLAGTIEDNKLKIVIDGRGKSMCPIAYAMQPAEIDKNFVRCVTKALTWLESIKDTNEYLKYITKLIKEDETINDLLTQG